MVFRYSQYPHTQIANISKRRSKNCYRLYTNCNYIPPRSGKGSSFQEPPRYERNTILLLSSRYLSPHTLHANRETLSQTKSQYPATVYRNTYNTLSLSSIATLHEHTYIATILTSRYIASLSHYSLLLADPPPIPEKESLLPRTETVAVAKARGEQPTIFPTYIYRI